MHCDRDNACDCVTYQPDPFLCWKRAACEPSEFVSDDEYSTYVKANRKAVPTTTAKTTLAPSSDTTTSLAPIGEYTAYEAKNCYNGAGGQEIDGDGVAVSDD